MNEYFNAKTGPTSKVHRVAKMDNSHTYSVCGASIATSRTRYGKQIQLTETLEDVTCARCLKWIEINE